jgi:hypothetical protein
VWQVCAGCPLDAHVGPQSRPDALGRPSGRRSRRIGVEGQRTPPGPRTRRGPSRSGAALSVLEVLPLGWAAALFRESFLTNLSPKTPSGTPAVAGGEYRTRRGTPFRVSVAATSRASHLCCYSPGGSGLRPCGPSWGAPAAALTAGLRALELRRHPPAGGTAQLTAVRLARRPWLRRGNSGRCVRRAEDREPKLTRCGGPKRSRLGFH